MFDKHNILELTDSYKITHANQYPPGTQHVYSYFESRSSPWSESVMFGLRYILEEYLAGIVVTDAHIASMKELSKNHFGNDSLFNEKGWKYIEDKHKGHLPLEIKAVPEGTRVPTGNVLMTVENTDPECWWLTNYVETLLVQAWYPITVATLSYEIRKLITQYLEETGDPTLVDFKLHDFGVRGASSMESAALGGAAHLINFLGTDNVPALSLLKKLYGVDCAGFSIPAAEHSTITSWGRAGEADAYANMLKQFPNGLVAVVSDSYDLYNACENIWGDKLKDEVLKRKDGFVVVRPDSGFPPGVVLTTLDILGKKFGYSTNDKGYKVLDPHIRVIQGDGIGYEMIVNILQTMKKNKWSTDNIAFGMGGALLQHPHRDTLGFAFKASSIVINGDTHDVYKEPATDAGKTSKRGRLKLIKQGGSFHTVSQGADGKDHLETVFSNGVLSKKDSFDTIRERARQIEIC